MARGDPADQALLRLESRRFSTRCETQIALVQRADSLRELARLATIPLPYRLAEDFPARDAQRHVAQAAEDRARELILEQIDHCLRAEPERREIMVGRLSEEWANLTGVLGHLRAWAKGKLAAARQIR